jgi:hypothetical protein
MASGGSKKIEPKWVIDLHGIREMLTTTINSAKVAAMDAIKSGEMLILRTAGDELKKLYPELWPQFGEIRPRKYIVASVAALSTSTQLMETYGASLLGSTPSAEHFEAIAVARLKKCTLISSGKALTDCQKIAKKCQLNANCVGGLALL